MSSKISLPSEPPPSKAQKERPPASTGLSENETYYEFVMSFVASLILASLLVILLPIPLLLIGEGFDPANLKNNPLTFGAFITGVIALVGLYYLIEKDGELPFEDHPGEAVQKIVTAIILLVGIVNLEWEFLSNWPKNVPTKFTLSDDPPLWELFKNLFNPNVLFLLIVTVLVFAVCIITRDSMALTPRGFRRKKRFLQQRLQDQSEVLRRYQTGADRLIASQLSDRRFRFPPRFMRMVRVPVFTVLSSAATTGLFFCVALISEHWGGIPAWGSSNLTRSEYVWFGVTFTTAWIFLEVALHIRKRYELSLGYLVSRAESNCMIALFSFFALVYLIVVVTIGAEATIAAAVAIAFRCFRQRSQMVVAKKLLNPNEIKAQK